MTLIPLTDKARSLALAMVATLATMASGSRGFDPKGMDRTVSPTTDFYQFANGTWLSQITVSPQRPRIGVFLGLTERNRELLHEVLESASNDSRLDASTPRGKLGLFYRVGMDEELAERQGYSPIKPELERIDRLTKPEQVAEELARLQAQGIGAGFRVGVAPDDKDSSSVIFQLSQGGLSLPNKQLYLADDLRSETMRTRFVATVTDELSLIGEDRSAANSHAAQVLDLETQLAKGFSNPIELRDPEANYHKLDVAGLAADAPDFPWSTYFRALGERDPGPIDLTQTKFLAAFDGAFQSVPVPVWREYLKVRLLFTTAFSLSKSFSDAQFSLFGSLRGQAEQAPRWLRVEASAESLLPDQLGQLFVQRAFPPEAKAKATEMALNIKSILRDRIVALDWMSSTTKDQALQKLDAMRVKVGYPDVWPTDQGLIIKDDSYAANALRAAEFQFRESMARLHKPVNHDLWHIAVTAVNAEYSTRNNEIYVPAGILQPPFFDSKAPDALNYGAIGAVVGHEMTHGFDDEGRKYDSAGNLRNWWTDEDAANFERLAAALVKQFDSYTLGPDLTVDGRLTLGENIADLGGLKIAYLAYKKATQQAPDGGQQPTIEGFTPDQLFFLSFAQLYREKRTPQMDRLLVANDPHAPGRYRVLGVLANTPEFWKAFGGTPPSDATKIW